MKCNCEWHSRLEVPDPIKLIPPSKKMRKFVKEEWEWFAARTPYPNCAAEYLAYAEMYERRN